MATIELGANFKTEAMARIVAIPTESTTNTIEALVDSTTKRSATFAQSLVVGQQNTPLKNENKPMNVSDRRLYLPSITKIRRLRLLRTIRSWLSLRELKVSKMMKLMRSTNSWPTQQFKTVPK
jgi:hypothetical protein